MSKQECSYCGMEKISVDRNRFDGMCAECTDLALYSYSVSLEAERRNKELTNNTR